MDVEKEIKKSIRLLEMFHEIKDLELYSLELQIIKIKYINYLFSCNKLN